MTPDKPSPQAVGAIVNWTANAIDTDGDQILYRYFLNGQPMTGWDADNTWTWNTTAANVGNNQIEVRVRDGQHAGPTGFDDRKTVSYIITAPAPKPPVIKPVIAPVNITPVAKCNSSQECYTGEECYADWKCNSASSCKGQQAAGPE